MVVNLVIAIVKPEDANTIGFCVKYGFKVTDHVVERTGRKPLYLIDLPQVQIRLSVKK